MIDCDLRDAAVRWFLDRFYSLKKEARNRIISVLNSDDYKGEDKKEVCATIVELLVDEPVKVMGIDEITDEFEKHVDFGKWLKKRRKKMGLNREELAGIIDISAPIIKDIETGCGALTEKAKEDIKKSLGLR